MAEFFAEFGLRDWLLVFGPLFIAGILIHGYWRMRMNRNSLKMSLDKSFVSDIGDASDDGDELSLLRAELPNGGARVREFTEQTSLNLNEDVPVLMDPIAEQSPVADSVEGVSRSGSISDAATASPAAPMKTDSLSTPVRETDAPQPEAKLTEETASELLDSSLKLPEKYVVINVMSIGEPFSGAALMDCLSRLKMRLGEMDIFHRHEGDKTLFSLMNAVEPGSFDAGTIREVQTPAVSMFMRVHELRRPKQIFEQMLLVADALAQELGGEVRDDTRSVMTTQTIEHCRQELEEYVFKNHP